jgi:hypothetical protein
MLAQVAHLFESFEIELFHASFSQKNCGTDFAQRFGPLRGWPEECSLPRQKIVQSGALLRRDAVMNRRFLGCAFIAPDVPR